MGKLTKEFAKQFMYLLRARKINPYINSSLEELITSVGFKLKNNIYLPDKNYVSIPLFGKTSIGKFYKKFKKYAKFVGKITWYRWI